MSGLVFSLTAYLTRTGWIRTACDDGTRALAGAATSPPPLTGG
jgi:hypothetical protein